MPKIAQPTLPRNRPVVTACGVVIDSQLPCAIVFLTNPSKDRRKNLIRLCNRYNVGIMKLDDDGSHMIAGAFGNLERVLRVATQEMCLVSDWHWTSNAKVPGQSLSVGPAKKTPKPKDNDKPQGDFPQWWPQYVTERHAK